MLYTMTTSQYKRSIPCLAFILGPSHRVRKLCVEIIWPRE
jgi:hypothetical protein